MKKKHRYAYERNWECLKWNNRIKEQLENLTKYTNSLAPDFTIILNFYTSTVRQAMCAELCMTSINKKIGDETILKIDEELNKIFGQVRIIHSENIDIKKLNKKRI